MIIISWDVGVIHLAYCVLQYTRDDITNKIMIEILDWNEINLIEDDRIKLECCGKLKTKKNDPEVKICGKNAIYVLVPGNYNKLYGFCKTHYAQHQDYWSKTQTKQLFKLAKVKKDLIIKHTCDYSNKNDVICRKNAKIVFRNKEDTDIDKKLYYCGAHYKMQFRKKLQEFSPQLIKKIIVRKYKTDQLQLTLVKKLDELAEHFAKLKIEEVIIENQPSIKNPKMKSISNTLFDYFMIRGYIDKFRGLDIKLVRMISPSNKLRVNEHNTIEVLKRDKTGKNKYKLTKNLSIQYTKQLLQNSPEQLEYLSCYKKQDDLCDAYLQGRYYLEFIRCKDTNKPKITKKNKKSNKSSKPSKSMNNGSKTDRKRENSNSRKKSKIIVL